MTMIHYFYDLTHFRGQVRNTEIFSLVFWSSQLALQTSKQNKIRTCQRSQRCLSEYAFAPPWPLVQGFLIFVVIATMKILSDIEPPLLFLLLLHATAQAQTERNSSTWERFYVNVFFRIETITEQSPLDKHCQLSKSNYSPAMEKK